jgi:hypothetical protein
MTVSLCKMDGNTAVGYYHSGLDPESRIVRVCDFDGCRIRRPGADRRLA